MRIPVSGDPGAYGADMPITWQGTGSGECVRDGWAAKAVERWMAPGRSPAPRSPESKSSAERFRYRSHPIPVAHRF